MARTIAYSFVETNVTDLKFQEDLYDFIAGASRIAILGVGNDLRTDDGLGLVIVSNLKHLEGPSLLVENVGSVPEAFAGNLSKFGAERVVMVDAADMLKPPGHIELITKDRIGGITLSTHRMPLSLLMQFLEDRTGARCIVLGVQPKSIEFGEGLTPEIRAEAEKIISTLEIMLKQHLRGIEDVQDD
ncbi:MAG: hydrogenase maturation peptidase HycI [Candidatus Thorarchaeota archaeon]